MRKVSLTMHENHVYSIIKDLVTNNGKQKRAALRLGCSLRSVQRYIRGYKEQGREYFIHGNHQNKPATLIPKAIKEGIISLYASDLYQGANLRHFNELLAQHEQIYISETSLRNIFKEYGLISPKAHRATRKYHNQPLKSNSKSAASPPEQPLETSLCVDPHPRREKSKYAGELIQLDATEHYWFGDTKAHLHLGIDDHTGILVGAWFDWQETLDGYYQVTSQILQNFGIPFGFYTDNRTVFHYDSIKKAEDKEYFTQFAFACQNLGIQLRTTSVPQAKGKVERLGQTLQSRLPIELRLAGVKTIEQANAFLISYIIKYSAQFGLPLNSTNSVFEAQMTKEAINLVLARLNERKIDSGCCVKFFNRYYMPCDENERAVYFRRGTKTTMIQSLNGDLFMAVNEKVYTAYEILDHAEHSVNFDPPKVEKVVGKKHIPSMTHPWKAGIYQKFSQEFVTHNLTFDELSVRQDVIIK